MTEQIVRELVNGEWVTRAVNATGGGPAPGTLVPVADSSSVTVDDTTYDNTVTGTGKLTTLVFPVDTVAFAFALEGDDFPRIIFLSDPTDSMISFGDGTADPYTTGSNIWTTSTELRLQGPGGGDVVARSPLTAHAMMTAEDSFQHNGSTLGFFSAGGGTQPAVSLIADPSMASAEDVADAYNALASALTVLGLVLAT